MITSKVHLIKALLNRLEGHSRFLIIGPMGIIPSILNAAIVTLKPELIIMVDGGMIHSTKLSPKNLSRSISVGDGDSFSNQLDLLLPQKKDYSDLSFVLLALKKYGLKSPIAKLAFLGFSSKKQEMRVDHLLFNLSGIESLASQLNLMIHLDNQYLFLPKGKNTFNSKGLFSLITFKSNKIKMTGKCEYQLTKWTKIPFLSSIGLSNIGFGKIQIETTQSIIIYFNKA